ncbi:MAG: hypothetical protein CMF42_01885, partial [Legionellales bacterium]|nr:hypothetical protein [Legionellales bacterium]
MVKIIIYDKNDQFLTALGFDKDIDEQYINKIKDFLTESTIEALSQKNESESDDAELGLTEEQERLIKQSIGECVDDVWSNSSEDMNEYHTFTFTFDTKFALFKNVDDGLILESAVGED